MAIYGYARVSTGEQADKYGLLIQVEQLKAYGVPRSHIYAEVQSGANENRPILLELLDKLQAGDTLAVSKIDRLARSTIHLLRLTKDFERQGIHFVSLGDSIDTTTPQGRFYFTVVSALAELERETIKERTRAGIHKRIKLGKGWGRRAFSQHDQITALKLLMAGESYNSVARALKCHPNTLYKYLPQRHLHTLYAALEGGFLFSKQ